MNVDVQGVLSSNIRLLQRITSSKGFGAWQKFDRASFIVDWFALYFAPNPKGSSSATAVQCEPGQITLFVALDSPPTTDDHVAGEHLISKLREVLSLDGSTKRRIMTLHRLIAEKAAPRIHRRLQMFLDVDRYQGTGAATLGLSGAFDQAVSYWESQGKEERSSRCVGASKEIFGDEDHGVAIIKAIFGELVKYVQEAVEIMNTGYSFDRWFPTIKNIWECLAIVFASDALRSVDSVFDDCLGKNLRFMRVLNIRTLHLFSYWNGAVKLVHHAIPIFRQTLGEDGVERFVRGEGDIHICWVNDLPSALPSPGESIRYSTTPAAHLNMLIEACALRSRHRPALREKLLQDERIAGAWGPDDEVIPRVHPELQLILHLSREGINVFGDQIGVSKRMCWACKEYLGIIHPKAKGIRRPKWKFSMVSGRIKHNWIPPPTPDGERVVGALMMRLLKNVSIELDLDLWDVDDVCISQSEFCGAPSQRCSELEELDNAGLSGWAPRTQHAT
ncbi:hypothetical protein CERSUDRAFT_118739 [Gelatoporia subvermispora B]|uniref:Uncharacterized protein n=1 Tax=Ceriporiopsis subvermispora (strain B) TaxID=914234 RepID=M2Q6C2_CERS8|nr:hypothetical protein CERSUDRAFT_118739 [Gelatoporia subvermispora B]